MKNGFVNTTGTLEIIKNSEGRSEGIYETYQFTTPEKMHAVALGFRWVLRPNGKYLRGSEYTLRMAKNDWNDKRYEI